MTYALITPPAAEALALAETKAHLRLDTTDEDDLVTRLITVAREHLERSTGLCLMNQSWRLHLDSICEDGVIPIARGPVQTIESVMVYDETGSPSALSLDGHVLDGFRRPARLMLPKPVRPGRAVNGIEIDFTAGFGATATDVPDTLKRAMLSHVAQMFSCRGVVAAEDQPALIPPGYDRLLAPFLIRSL
ncbi:MAG: head-tail connector protein [Pantoea sp.]|uniref:head-tail connector protein n=1 Tax=Pantoea sp. TaxID=69393 RepID=UPI0023A76287|nr:head-tail connector protein [Pantoea sp.]MDE1186273.1 head-tail connector protein [Pantoea sp.]